MEAGGMEGEREGAIQATPVISGDLTSLSDFADELPTSKKKDLVIHVICFGDFKALKGEGELGRRNLGTRGRKENSSRNLNDEFKIQTMNFGGDRTPYE